MEPTEFSPIFLLGSERSGTNLLRTRLNECQNVYFGGSPAHFLKHLFFSEYKYGDMQEDANFLQMIDDALKLCYVHFSPWNKEYNSEEILELFKDKGAKRNAVQLSHFLLTQYAQDNGRQSYFCKDNYLYEFWSQIEREIPNCRFIYLHRDPRDCVLSQLKRPGSNLNVLKSTRLWEYEQNKSIAAYNYLKSDGRCFKLSYEQLLLDEKKVIKSLCDFIGVEQSGQQEHQDNMELDVHEWKNLNKKTDVSNMNKYKKEFSDFSIAIIEQTCWEIMNFLEYNTDNQSRPKVARYKKVVYSFLKICQKKIKSVFTKKSRDDARSNRSKLIRKFNTNYRNPD